MNSYLPAARRLVLRLGPAGLVVLFVHLRPEVVPVLPIYLRAGLGLRRACLYVLVRIIMVVAVTNYIVAEGPHVGQGLLEFEDFLLQLLLLLVDSLQLLECVFVDRLQLLLRLLLVLLHLLLQLLVLSLKIIILPLQLLVLPLKLLVLPLMFFVLPLKIFVLPLMFLVLPLQLVDSLNLPLSRMAHFLLDFVHLLLLLLYLFP